MEIGQFLNLKVHIYTFISIEERQVQSTINMVKHVIFHIEIKIQHIMKDLNLLIQVM